MHRKVSSLYVCGSKGGKRKEDSEQKKAHEIVLFPQSTLFLSKTTVATQRQPLPFRSKWLETSSKYFLGSHLEYLSAVYYLRIMIHYSDLCFGFVLYFGLAASCLARVGLIDPLLQCHLSRL